MPTIVNNLGYSAARAQGMTAPPYLFGCLSCVVFALVADRIKQRAYVMAAAFGLALIGFAIVMGTAGNPGLTGVTLFGIFLTAAGLYSATPPMMAWVANIFEGEVKRGIAISIVPTIGQFGGVVGSNIYLVKEKPFYHTGFGVSIAVVFFCGLVTTLGLRFALARVNHNRDQIPIEEIRAKYTEEELTEMGDMSPLYRVGGTFLRVCFVIELILFGFVSTPYKTSSLALHSNGKSQAGLLFRSRFYFGFGSRIALTYKHYFCKICYRMA